jgi:hypothetical protein
MKPQQQGPTANILFSWNQETYGALDQSHLKAVL